MDFINIYQAKIALSAILGVLGAIAITGHELDGRKGILVWLVFVLVSGLLVNNQKGMPLSFLSLCAAISALSLAMTIAWLIFLGVQTNFNLPISGIDINF